MKERTRKDDCPVTPKAMTSGTATVEVASIYFSASASASKKSWKSKSFCLRKKERPSVPVIRVAWLMHPPPIDEDPNGSKEEPVASEIASATEGKEEGATKFPRMKVRPVLRVRPAGWSNRLPVDPILFRNRMLPRNRDRALPCLDWKRMSKRA